MPPLTSLQRRELRARAHALHPVVAIGQHGLTPTVLHEIDVALLAHDLIKVRVLGDDRDERDALLTRICDELACAPVQHIGKLLVLWRPNPDRKPRAPRRHAKAKPEPAGTRDPRKRKSEERGDARKKKSATTRDDARRKPTARDDARPPRPADPRSGQPKARGRPDARRRRGSMTGAEASQRRDAGAAEAPAPRQDQSRRRRRAVKT